MTPAAPPRTLLRMLSDERLARLAAGGSEPAFAVIYGRHADALAACCRSIVRHEDDARDALQNAMLKAWCAIGRRGDAPLRPWLLRIARNESIDVLRRRRTVSELRDEVPATGDVHEHTAHRAELAQVLDSLDDLSERQREALVLRTLGGVGYAEIARIQETSQDAVRQSVSVARRSLRRGRLAGIVPVPAWLAEFVAAGAGGGASMPVGRVAVTVTATIAAAGGLGSALPHVHHRRATATASAAVVHRQEQTSTVAAATPPAAVHHAVSGTIAAARRRSATPATSTHPATSPAGGAPAGKPASHDRPRDGGATPEPPSPDRRRQATRPLRQRAAMPLGILDAPGDAVRTDASGRPRDPVMQQPAQPAASDPATPAIDDAAGRAPVAPDQPAVAVR